MIKRVVLAMVVAILCTYTHAQITPTNDSVQATIVLVGDAGKLINGKQLVVEAVKKTIALDKKTTIIYLGDNIYEMGLPDDASADYARAKAAIDAQINIADNTASKVYVIPGNHDWANGKRDGYAAMLRVQKYIDNTGKNNVQQLPRDACPGPIEKKISDDVTLVMIDSQWWLQQNDKPGVESDCDCKTKSEVLLKLDDILAQNDKKLVIIAFHHPMRSYGQHGGYFTLKQHVFPLTDYKKNLYIPLPIVGTSYPLTRAVFGTAQDVKHPFYQDMIATFENAIKGHPNVIFVSGHEHTLQLIKDTNYINIVSGSGSKSSRVSKSRNTLYASPDMGFATMSISKNKTVRTTFYTVNGQVVEQTYSENIMDFSKIKKLEATDSLREPEVVFKDSVIISASDKYKKYSGFKNYFLGSNYRKEWNEGVKLKVFNLRKQNGGFKIVSLGGGKQTKSLRLTDNAGKEWVLRTIDKDPEKALPENLRRTIGQAIVTDVISASNPYAPFIVPTLAKAVGVPASEPKYFFVPDDPAFGYYRPLFANTVCMLEDRQPTPDESDTKSTPKIINKMLEDNDHHVDQPAVLKARLLDMYIGDFDRHADQWRWGTADTGKGKLYYPVPKDRDQAFFYSNGLFIKYLSYFGTMPYLQGFKSHIQNINGLNFVARDFDRTFMNGLDKTQWKTIADSFVYKMTDEVINKATAKFPTEIKPMDAAITSKKLMDRRNVLVKNALKYYTFLAEKVTVTGSNEEEYFHVKKDAGGINLTVYSKTKKSDTALVNYKRTFFDDETKELILFGLNGDDKFEIDTDVASKIKIRIVGGKGLDTFNLKGNNRNVIYDLSTEKNVLVNTNKTINRFSSNVNVLDYKSTGYQYNSFAFPQINVGFNAEDGLLLGVGFTKKTYGFRKFPYATMQKVTTLAAPNRGAFQAKYEAVFNEVLFNKDIVVNAEIVTPTLTNFFGYGNQSVYDKSKPLTFYRTRYKYNLANVFLRKRFGDILQVSVGPSYYRYYNEFEDNKGRILENPANIGNDSIGVYATKEYVGGKLKLDVSYLNNDIFPTRGITWFTTFSSMQGINKNSKNFTDFQTDMTIYGAISDLSKVSGIIRLGGGHNFTKQYEFFQAKTLGVNNYLRGFRRNRFSGRGMVYGGGELRVKLLKSRSYILPGDIGVLGYADVGRVWQPGENSNKWHNSLGGGFYFVPFNLVAITASMGFSSEERLFNFSLGTKFNLNF